MLKISYFSSMMKPYNPRKFVPGKYVQNSNEAILMKKGILTKKVKFGR